MRAAAAAAAAALVVSIAVDALDYLAPMLFAMPLSPIINREK
jgi:hypothetical protein